MSINFFTGLLAALLLGTLISKPALAENFQRGQELYGNHCQACHANLVHLSKNRKVNSLSELRKRVTSWATHAGENWGDSEVDDVLFYLNRTFYHFKEEPL
jgi:mono/diheme cytochrome c family protein